MSRFGFAGGSYFAAPAQLAAAGATFIFGDTMQLPEIVVTHAAPGLSGCDGAAAASATVGRGYSAVTHPARRNSAGKSGVSEFCERSRRIDNPPTKSDS
jgi:hypothetical protein